MKPLLLMKTLSLRSLFRHLHHTVLFLLVWTVFLNGCSSWRTLEEPPNQTDPQKVLITLTDQSEIIVYEAYVEADTLYGYESEGVEPKLGIPVSDIASIEQQYKDKTSVALFFGQFAVAGLAYLVIAGGAFGF